MHGLENVGADKAIQNPQDAISRKHGTYKETVEPGKHVLQTPKVEVKNPYRITSTSSGSRD